MKQGDGRDAVMLRAIAIAMMLGACGGKELPAVASSNVVAVPDAGPVDASPTWAEQVVATMSGLADDMCKCVDIACVEVVHARMSNWSAEMAAERDRTKQTIDDATNTKMKEIGLKYGECMSKAMSATP